MSSPFSELIGIALLAVLAVLVLRIDRQERERKKWYEASRSRLRDR
jgi:hypothetical protein